MPDFRIGKGTFGCSFITNYEPENLTNQFLSLGGIPNLDSSFYMMETLRSQFVNLKPHCENAEAYLFQTKSRCWSWHFYEFIDLYTRDLVTICQSCSHLKCSKMDPFVTAVFDTG